MTINEFLERYKGKKLRYPLWVDGEYFIPWGVSEDGIYGAVSNGETWIYSMDYLSTMKIVYDWEKELESL